jgi:DNA-binding response OmpR family regulator
VTYCRAVARVTLVEDDAAIRVALTEALTDRGHRVFAAGTALDGLRLVREAPPELVVLDLGLPDIDGSEFLRMLRAVSAVPVLVATARDDENEIVATLEAGADDYVVKPFSAAHLDARIRAVLRRSAAGSTAGPITVGELSIDPRSREAALAGRPLVLSRKEFDLLCHLARHAGEVVPRRELLLEVWGQQPFGEDRTVDVHLSWLRAKLGETAAEPRYLRTVRGVGVRLDAPPPGGR